MENKSLPFVSIITPAYNAMPFLKTTIENVLNQDYPNLEHIVFDGGSKDNSVEILKSYSHPFMVKFINSFQDKRRLYLLFELIYG